MAWKSRADACVTEGEFDLAFEGTYLGCVEGKALEGRTGTVIIVDTPECGLGGYDAECTLAVCIC